MHDAVLALSPTVTATADPTGTGLLLTLTTAAKATARQVFPLGCFRDTVLRWTSCYRYEPYWMYPAWGDRLTAVPRETQFLLAELADGRVGLIVPLIDGAFRCSLEGHCGELQILAESGDPAIVTQRVTGAFVAVGDDPHVLVAAAARAVLAHQGVGRLREDKPLPAFVDRFGWCTWDAFYKEVDPARIRAGLESFRAAGVSPRYMILDDGWQAEEEDADGSRRITSLDPNPKFGGDLAATVAMAKGEFGIGAFLVWHAVTGYWGGIDQKRLPAYGARLQARRSSPGIVHYSPTHDQWFGPSIAVPAAELLHRFYHDYHRRLRAMGVDGVKVDGQASLETVAEGQGGRVALMHRVREALEGSVAVHFQGNLINCMSCSAEMLYAAAASTLTRTSTDFWPKRPETHALHLATNAWVGLWFGEFCHPDWDMFQSGHPAGAYHAAGRAVSGAPIYVSDKPGEHNPGLLRKLVLSDGGVGRCLLPGRPSRDSLFADPLNRDALMKIVNRTAVNAVVGAFNGRYHAEESARSTVRGRVAPGDVPGLHAADAVSWCHYAARLGRGAVEVALPELGAEVVTFTVPDRGLAVIGLTRLFAPGTGVAAAGWDGGTWRAQVRDGGEFLVHTDFAPSAVTFAGQAVPWKRDADGGIRIDLPGAGELRIAR